MADRRTVQKFVKLRSTRERRLFSASKVLFARQGKKVAKQYESNGLDGALGEIDRQIDDWKALLKKFYSETIGTLATQQLKTVEKIAQKSDLSDKFILDSFEWIEGNALKQSVLITGTSRKVAQQIIEQGLDEGISSVAISREISKQFSGTLARHRSQAIARTETGNAASYAQDLGARESGLDLMKEWVAVSDDATRDGHVSISGQRIGMDDTFTVEGFGGTVDHMLHPNQDGASAGNVINCRCILAYTPV